MTNIGILVSAGLALSAISPSVALAQSQTDTGMGGATLDREMMATGLFVPPMDSTAGMRLFASKGCVVCHSINGVGGTDAPTLDAANMPSPMNPFEFAARMWRGAQPMVMMQRDELGGQIELTGQELADIIAFAHDPGQQAKFKLSDVPEKWRKKLSK